MWYLAWYYFDTKKLNKAKEYGDLREKIWIFPQNTKQICLVLEKLCRVGVSFARQNSTMIISQEITISQHLSKTNSKL